MITVAGLVFVALMLMSMTCESIAQARQAPGADSIRVRIGWGKRKDFTSLGWRWRKRGLVIGGIAAIGFLIGVIVVGFASSR